MPKKETKATEAAPAEGKKECGLIMPISARDGLPDTHWLEIRSIIEKSLASLDLNVRLVSDGEASDVIHKTILQRLYTSDVCVCDISTLNPNVMFELGIRLCFEKPTVIIGDDATALPFDTGLIRRLPYPRDLRYQKIQKFMALLKKAVGAAIEAENKGDRANSFMSVLGPIKIPTLDTQEVPGIQLLVEEVRELKQMVVSRNRGQPIRTVEFGAEFIEQIISAIRRLRASGEIQQKIPTWEKMADSERRILIEKVFLEMEKENPRVSGLSFEDLEFALAVMR